MKELDKVKFTVPYFRKIFDYKQMCKELTSFPTDLLGQFLWSSALKNSEDKDLEPIMKRLYTDKTIKFAYLLETKVIDGTLLPFFSDNFKLIHSLKMNIQRAHLIYSKYNKKYYFLNMFLFWDDKNKEPLDQVDVFDVAKIFKNKKKLTTKEFFQIIVENDKKKYSEKEFKTLIKDKVYVDEKGRNLFDLYINKK